MLDIRVIREICVLLVDILCAYCALVHLHIIFLKITEFPWLYVRFRDK